MRISLLAAFGALSLATAGCSWIPFLSKSNSPADDPKPQARAEPGQDFGLYPHDFQQRVVQAFQAKWRGDPIYNYRFELPRRVELSQGDRKGYAVRFSAQNPTRRAPMAPGFPWVAYFENGLVVWVQRESEVGSSLRWFDGAQRTVDWPPPSAPQS